MGDVWEPKVGDLVSVLCTVHDTEGDESVAVDFSCIPEADLPQRYAEWRDRADVAPWMSAADQAAYLAVVRAADALAHDILSSDGYCYCGGNVFRDGHWDGCKLDACLAAVDALTPEQRQRVMGGETT